MVWDAVPVKYAPECLVVLLLGVCHRDSGDSSLDLLGISNVSKLTIYHTATVYFVIPTKQQRRRELFKHCARAFSLSYPPMDPHASPTDHGLARDMCAKLELCPTNPFAFQSTLATLKHTISESGCKWKHKFVEDIPRGLSPFSAFY